LLGNSLTLTVSAVDHVLVNAGSDATGTTYRLVDSAGTWTIRVQHAYAGKNGRNRVNLNAKLEKISADVLIPAQNVLASASISITCDFPSFGFTPAEVGALFVGARTLTDGTLMGKVINGET